MFKNFTFTFEILLFVESLFRWMSDCNATKGDIEELVELYKYVSGYA